MVAVCEDPSTTTEPGAANTTTPAASAAAKESSHCDCEPHDEARRQMRHCRLKYKSPTKTQAIKLRKAERQAFINCTAEHARDMHAVEYVERLFDDVPYRKEVYDCYYKERKAIMLEKGLSPELSNRSYRKCLADAMKLKGKKI
ncbi:hypothetical protein HPB52_022419 [Rhipicephalus sanguineus]|uniref:Uncharacterized protein n=2 Tax=Rhipicephalus sanguineus TaxID=34632 RepID=A0A9D4T212_RHISA|nr:hypothetical protein HPB52_022419 [Rhipicephalus sanguineus]